MSAENVAAIRGAVTRALADLMPSGRDDGWIERMVGPSRFGWDWEALERGFFGPFRRWAADHPDRGHPVLAGLVVEARGGSVDRYADVLAILELEYLAAIMLEDVRNARDLGGAVTDAVDLPLPAWLTVAYNIRQLVPVMVVRHRSALTPGHQRWLAQRCARFLCRQGVGNTLDLWGAERDIAHGSTDEFVDHLRLHTGNLSFGLACDFASAILCLDTHDADRLRRAGIELGVAHLLGALAADRSGDAGRLAGQAVRWRRGVDPTDLPGLAVDARKQALALAHDVGPGVADAFEAFLSVHDAPAREGGRS